MRIIDRISLTVFLLLLATAGAADTETRQSLTSQGQGITRGSVGDGKLTFDERAPLREAGASAAARKPPERRASSGVTARSGNVNFWFYDADVVLFNDLDRDGYYFGIDLEFDAATHYGAAEVYAVLYLSYDYGPWEEYAETDDFTLFGASGTDSYIVETELVSGYPTGDYDILIELYAADDSAYLAGIGPGDTSELALLPLEDSVRDTPQAGGTQVVVSSGGGGAFGWLLLSSLLAIRMTLRPQRARLSK